MFGARAAADPRPNAPLRHPSCEHQVQRSAVRVKDLGALIQRLEAPGVSVRAQGEVKEEEHRVVGGAIALSREDAGRSRSLGRETCLLHRTASGSSSPSPPCPPQWFMRVAPRKAPWFSMRAGSRGICLSRPPRDHLREALSDFTDGCFRRLQCTIDHGERMRSRYKEVLVLVGVEEHASSEHRLVEQPEE